MRIIRHASRFRRTCRSGHQASVAGPHRRRGIHLLRNRARAPTPGKARTRAVPTRQRSAIIVILHQRLRRPARRQRCAHQPVPNVIRNVTRAPPNRISHVIQINAVISPQRRGRIVKRISHHLRGIPILILCLRRQRRLRIRRPRNGPACCRLTLTLLCQVSPRCPTPSIETVATGRALGLLQLLCAERRHSPDPVLSVISEYRPSSTPALNTARAPHQFAG